MTGVVTPYTLMFYGLMFVVAPLFPLGEPAYIKQTFRDNIAVTGAFYVLAILGAMFGAYAFRAHMGTAWWAASLALPLIYWFVIVDRNLGADEKPQSQEGDTNA